MARRKNPQQVAMQAQAQANRVRNSQLLATYAANPGSIPGLKGVARPAVPGGVPAQSPPGQPQQGSAEFVPDAAYLAAAAQRQFERQQALQNLTTQGDTDKADTQEAIRRLLGQAPQARQNIKQNANRAGLFYSGQLGKQLDDYQGELTRQQGDIELDAQRRETARAAARQAIESGAPLEEAAALAEAATRQVGRDSEAASAGALVPTPSAVAPPAAKVVASPGRRARAKALQRKRRR